MPKNFNEVFAIIIEQEPFIYDVEDAPCKLCTRITDLRCGVCFKCKDRVRVTDDLTEVYEYANPSNRWPFVYRTAPKDSRNLDRAMLKTPAELSSLFTNLSWFRVMVASSPMIWAHMAISSIRKRWLPYSDRRA